MREEVHNKRGYLAGAAVLVKLRLKDKHFWGCQAEFGPWM